MMSRGIRVIVVTALAALLAAASVLVGCSQQPSGTGTTAPGSSVTTPSKSEEASENDSIESTQEEKIESGTTTPSAP